MAEPLRFTYRAVDGAGRRVRGSVVAANDAGAFEQLRRDGLSPVSLKASRGPDRSAAPAKVQALRDRETAELVSSLAELLRAGADMRTALSILGARAERPAVKSLCQALSNDISGGEAIDQAFGRRFPQGQAFVGAMVAGGEAAGDLPGGLQRAADMIGARLKLRDQMISILAYPTFVLFSAVAAVFVILLFIIPTIAPLATDSGATPPLALGLMISASNALRDNFMVGLAGTGIFVVLVVVAARMGALRAPLSRLVLDGPARRTVGAVTYGAFSISLGTMLAAGAPVSDALRLSTRAVGFAAARSRLEPVGRAVREGQFLSDALGQVRGFPPSIVRLAAVGEATNTLGSMLARSGKLEEEAAIRRIETVGRLAGPALIVFLGLVLGLVMGGLLSGVSALGQSALQ